MRAGLLLLLLVGAACDSRFADGPPAPPGAPNMLLVSVDSLRHDHLGCYGYARDTSPAIDALAAEGVRFETALAPTSWTLPSHMTLLTALPPVGHGVIGPLNRLRDDVRTLAEALSAQGDATAGFVSGPLVHSTFGFAQGFDLYDD